ncbi:MAG: phospholipase D-like domain-containing protein [Planctomycetota bacterium]|jgi:phosphatidylserine/phosphatidylglycerophosphate/cardiolipin synthase-like enzyme
MKLHLLATSTVIAAVAAVIVLHPLGALGREKGPDITVHFSPEGGVMKAVIREIRASKKSLDVGLYMLTSSKLSREIVSAHKRGVKVRVLLDKRMVSKWSKADTLEEGGVPLWLLYLKKNRDMISDPKFHHKFAVIDRETVITGSYNWTVMADESNHENLLVIRDRKLASAYTAVFEKALKLAQE